MAKRNDKPTETASTTSMLDDEMQQIPDAPTGAESGQGTGKDTTDDDEPTEADIQAGASSSDFDDVPDAPETMKKGKFAFRIDEYEEHEKNGEPYFSLKLVCEQEPYTGRITYDICPWIDEETLAASRDPSNPDYQQARRTKRERLWKANAIMKAAKFKPSGNFDFKEFLDSQPTVGVEGGPVERKAKTGKKDKKGKDIYKGTGKMGWKPSGYFPLA